MFTYNIIPFRPNRITFHSGCPPPRETWIWEMCWFAGRAYMYLFSDKYSYMRMRVIHIFFGNMDNKYYHADRGDSARCGVTTHSHTHITYTLTSRIAHWVCVCACEWFMRRVVRMLWGGGIWFRICAIKRAECSPRSANAHYAMGYVIFVVVCGALLLLLLLQCSPHTFIYFIYYTHTYTNSLYPHAEIRSARPESRRARAAVT